MHRQKLEMEAASLFPLDLTVKTSIGQKTTAHSNSQSLNATYLAGVNSNSASLAKKRKLDGQASNSSDYNSDEDEEDANTIQNINEAAMSNMATQASVAAAVVAANLQQMIKDYSKFNGNMPSANTSTTNTTGSSSLKQAGGLGSSTASLFSSSTPLKQIQSIADSYLLTTQFNKEKLRETEGKYSASSSNRYIIMEQMFFDS